MQVVGQYQENDLLTLSTQGPISLLSAAPDSAAREVVLTTIPAAIEILGSELPRVHLAMTRPIHEGTIVL